MLVLLCRSKTGRNEMHLLNVLVYHRNRYQFGAVKTVFVFVFFFFCCTGFLFPSLVYILISLWSQMGSGLSGGIIIPIWWWCTSTRSVTYSHICAALFSLREGQPQPHRRIVPRADRFIRCGDFLYPPWLTVQFPHSQPFPVTLFVRLWAHDVCCVVFLNLSTRVQQKTEFWACKWYRLRWMLFILYIKSFNRRYKHSNI